jgi:hypothetical protein
MGRTFPTGVGAPALLEEPVQDDSGGYDPSAILLIHRFQALLEASVWLLPEDVGDLAPWVLAAIRD